MRQFGKLVVAVFFLSQLTHAATLWFLITPRFREKYAYYEPIPTLFLCWGWVLCAKVTYLYWRVSCSNAGTPRKDIVPFGNNRDKKMDAKLPLDK
jgi:hypothetical protein